MQSFRKLLDSLAITVSNASSSLLGNSQPVQDEGSQPLLEDSSKSYGTDSSFDPITNLPPELLEKILGYSTIKEVNRLARTSATMFNKINGLHRKVTINEKPQNLTYSVLFAMFKRRLQIQHEEEELKNFENLSGFPAPEIKVEQVAIDFNQYLDNDNKIDSSTPSNNSTCNLRTTIFMGGMAATSVSTTVGIIYAGTKGLSDVACGFCVGTSMCVPASLTMAACYFLNMRVEETSKDIQAMRKREQKLIIEDDKQTSTEELESEKDSFLQLLSPVSPSGEDSFLSLLVPTTTSSSSPLTSESDTNTDEVEEEHRLTRNRRPPIAAEPGQVDYDISVEDFTRGRRA